MKCNQVREYLRFGGKPGADVRQHIGECDGCSEAFNREKRLSRLIRSMPVVEPPGDFDSVLREKIESRRSSSGFGHWLTPSVLVPVAAGAAILLVVAFAFNSFLSSYSDTRGKSVATESSPPQTSESPRAIESTGSEAPLGDTVAQSEQNVAEGPSDDRTDQGSRDTVPRDEKEDEVPGGGSIDFGARPADSTDPDWVGRPETDPSGPPSREFSPAEILSELGIEAKFSGSVWKVITVRPGSIGARTGVKTGDVVKAIDGRELGRSVGGAVAAGRRLTIVRNGREMTIPIRP
ncbi:MAG: hypothetical protein DWQ47_14950 [Acidobacteria bacterium]|nr:MAG: hypothetical protein DWQ32_02350 [Acidobacteriota bacterium]REK02637.1 MAG: hypothetical protein DWQ38_09785 [Acidobacteriota bacterium]REK13559.1 MAG: hypothetical protein DWQ43_08040 [Acidobacteriota bacterium]REK41553.1 MAG: hypothetical protein DWQ47_14950 [Acidobacteriota bacterium]